MMMPGRGPRNAHTRAEAERARLYAARKSWHQGRISRRVRDNTLAGIIGGIIIVGAVVSQSVHAAVTAPEPEPTKTTTPAPVENPFSDLFSPEGAAE
jgi:hypothetical protein